MTDGGIKLDDFKHMDVRDGRLYWKGEPVITERRFSTQERVIGWIGVAVGLVVSLATVAQAWAAWLSIPHH